MAWHGALVIACIGLCHHSHMLREDAYQQPMLLEYFIGFTHRWQILDSDSDQVYPS